MSLIGGIELRKYDRQDIDYGTKDFIRQACVTRL